MATTSSPRAPRARCSFCGKDASAVERLYPGLDNVFICNECIALCRDVVGGAGQQAEPTLGSMRPPAIRAFLDEHVVGQDRAKTALSVAVYNHFKRIRDDRRDDPTEISKGNILMIGPTGCGKTLMARTIARKLGVPFTIADATSLTEAGYVGEDVESIVKSLWIAADKDTSAAGRGIACIDEVDKIAKSGGTANNARDVGGEGVQQALLKVIEGQRVTFSPDGSKAKPQQDLIEVDTTHVLFVCCGGFDGLHEIVEQRVATSSIGFGASREKVKLTRNELVRRVTPQDLNKYGMIPEFIGRLPIIVTLDELSETEMVEILWKPKNALVRQYQSLFAFEDVKLRFHHEAMTAIVAEAAKRGSGARGLRSILESIMLDVMYELPSLEDVRECVITEACVTERAQPLLTRRHAA